MKILPVFKKWGTVVAAITAALLTVLLGIILIVQVFSRSNEELISEHNQHQMDIAWSTDRNLATLLQQTEDALNYAVTVSVPQEDEFLSAGDSEQMLEYLRSIPLTKPDYISMILLLRGDEVLLCTADDGDCCYTFPYGVNPEAPCICADETGKNYLAIIASSVRSELSYVALIDLQEFYRQAAGNELTKDYWMVLYDAEYDIFLQNDATQPEVFRFTAQEAMERDDGYSLLTEGELSQQVITQTYVFPVDGKNNVRNLMAVIPTGINDNGVFAVGVSVEIEHVSDLLNMVFWRVLISGLLIIIGIGIMLRLYFRNRRTNEEIREQNASMQELLDKTRALAHHQRLELIGTMTSGIAHEFNNLLTPIMGNSILCMEQLPEGSDELMDNLTEIYDASNRAKTLISRISALSRKNNQAVYSIFSPEELLDKVEQIANSSRPENVSLRREKRCNEARLYGNETQIGQLFLNIVINAFQAMAESGGTLTISSETAGENITFEFRDNGPGIQAEALPQIFDPFFTTKEKGSGTGLGLAISRRIAEEHGGTISVESLLGNGTVFTVTLPRSKDSTN